MANNKEFFSYFKTQTTSKAGKSVFQKIFEEIQGNDSDSDSHESSCIIWQKIISPKKDINLSVESLEDKSGSSIEYLDDDNQSVFINERTYMNDLHNHVTNLLEILKSSMADTKRITKFKELKSFDDGTSKLYPPSVKKTDFFINNTNNENFNNSFVNKTSRKRSRFDDDKIEYNEQFISKVNCKNFVVTQLNEEIQIDDRPYRNYEKTKEPGSLIVFNPRSIVNVLQDHTNKILKRMDGRYDFRTRKIITENMTLKRAATVSNILDNSQKIHSKSLNDKKKMHILVIHIKGG